MIILGIQKVRLTQIKSRNENSFTDLGQEIISMSVPVYEEFIALDGQTDFILNHDYVIGNNSLKVFVNGLYQDLGIDKTYIEVDKNTIRFNEGLVDGDWIMIRIEGAGSGTTLENHIHITRENLSGSINGINKVFTLKYVPRIGTEMVFKNGLLQSSNGEDYIIVGNTITFVEPPLKNSKLVASYIV